MVIILEPVGHFYWLVACFVKYKQGYHLHKWDKYIKIINPILDRMYVFQLEHPISGFFMISNALKTDSTFYFS